MRDIKVGNIVHVRGEVYDTLRDRMLVDFSTDEKSDVMWVPISAIVHVEPRPIKVGDRVRYLDLSEYVNGTVLALDNSCAWVRADDCGYRVKAVCNLTRIEGEPS